MYLYHYNVRYMYAATLYGTTQPQLKCMQHVHTENM